MIMAVHRHCDVCLKDLGAHLNAQPFMRVTVGDGDTKHIETTKEVCLECYRPVEAALTIRGATEGTP